MTKTEAQIERCMEFCRSCIHFDFCSVYWGAECKRQGGKKIPRMTTKPIEAILKINRQEFKKPEKTGRQIMGGELIRTKLANW